MAGSSNLEAEAQRALAIGEMRFLAGDVAGARQCAQHALSRAPGLPGAEQALVAYDVHSAAAPGPGPGPDWYAVLGLPPSGGATDITHDDIKRQHRKLCLLVHPDKNASAAADGAFKLVQAAYDALTAVSLPPPPTTDRRPTWEEELSRFWQTAADDVTPPPPVAKQPPIAPPTPSWASPPPVGQPAPATAAGVLPRLAQAPISWTPPEQAAPAPGPPERPLQRPSCPLLPYCLFCRPFTAGTDEGFSVHDELPTGEFREFGHGDDYYYR